MTLDDGPQLNGADLGSMLRDDLEALAGIVALDLSAAESLFKAGEISREQLRWVQSDAERVRDELIRREEAA